MLTQQFKNTILDAISTAPADDLLGKYNELIELMSEECEDTDEARIAHTHKVLAKADELNLSDADFINCFGTALMRMVEESEY